MKITYDKEVDALYVYFKKAKVAATRKVAENVLVDLDKGGNVIGLEVLDASRTVRGAKRKTEIAIGKRTILLPALVP